MSTGRSRESMILRINENFVILLKLLILHDGTADWFTARHKQEMKSLILDAVQQRWKTIYDLQKEAKENKKKGSEQNKTDGDKHVEGMIRGETLKVGYKFSKRSSNLHCMLPNSSASLSPTSEDAQFSGGGYNSVNVFPEILDLYICEYRPDRGQQTEITSMMSSTERGSPKISDYFTGASQTNRRRVHQTESAVKKKIKLKNIIKKTSKSNSASIPKKQISVGGRGAGGFFSQNEIISHNEIKQRCRQKDTNKTSQQNEPTERREGSQSGEEEEEEAVMFGRKEPIYIASDADSDASDGSYIFDNVKTTQGGIQSKEMVLKNDNGAKDMSKSAGVNEDETCHAKSDMRRKIDCGDGLRDGKWRNGKDATDGKYHSAYTKGFVSSVNRQKEQCNDTEASKDTCSEKLDAAPGKSHSDENSSSSKEGVANSYQYWDSLLKGTDDVDGDVQTQNNDFGDFWSLGQEVETQRMEPSNDAVNNNLADDDEETTDNIKNSVSGKIKCRKDNTVPKKRIESKKRTKKEQSKLKLPKTSLILDDSQNNLTQSKLKFTKQTSQMAGKKRTMSNVDSSDDESQNNLEPKSKKLLPDPELFFVSSRGKRKEKSDDVCNRNDESKGQRSQETIGQRLFESKENTEPVTSTNVVDLCSDDDEDDEDDILGPSDSLIDVLGDKRDVRKLNGGDIEYLMKRNKQYFKRIFSGKIACRRHQDYKAGGYLRSDLNHSVRFGPFTDEQQDTIVRALIHQFCRKHNHYFDYVTKVLLPEALAKICMDIQGVSHQDAEKFLRETPSASFCA